ncbi:MAG: hypothetical protein ACI3ZD_03740 [Prevotella sp.]
MKKTLLTIVALLCIVGSEAKNKEVVWEKPTTEYNADNKRDIVFHFQPLPLDTKVFDFIEGESDKAFKICGIRPIEERQRMLFPSYWRNESTGN